MGRIIGNGSRIPQPLPERMVSPEIPRTLAARIAEWPLGQSDPSMDRLVLACRKVTKPEPPIIQALDCLADAGWYDAVTWIEHVIANGWEVK